MPVTNVATEALVSCTRNEHRMKSTKRSCFEIVRPKQSNRKPSLPNRCHSLDSGRIGVNFGSTGNWSGGVLDQILEFFSAV